MTMTEEMDTVKRTCAACWHPAKRGDSLIQWRGLADFEASAANPMPKLATWTIHQSCAKALNLA